MHDELALRALWQAGTADTDTLLAAVRRERKRQRCVLAMERTISAIAFAVGFGLLLPADATLRLSGVAVLAFASAGIVVAQWSRAALVARLTCPVDGAGITDDARIIRRQVVAGWIMLGAAVLFIVSIVVLSSYDSHALTKPLRLSVMLAAAITLAGAAVWQCQFARRRGDQLRTLLGSDGEMSPPASGD